MFLVLVFSSCSALHSLVIDEGEILKRKETTHRIAVKGNIQIAKMAIKNGLPVTVHGQDLGSDVSAGYNYAGGYGLPGQGYGGMMSPAGMHAEAASFGYGQSHLPQLGESPVVFQAGQPTAQVTESVKCPKGRATANESERIACLDAVALIHSKQIHALEKRR